MPIPQFNRLIHGGLLVVVEDMKVVGIKTKEDIGGISPPNRITIQWKKPELLSNAKDQSKEYQ